MYNGNGYDEAEDNTINIALSEQRRGQKQFGYPQKSWRCNTITHGL